MGLIVEMTEYKINELENLFRFAQSEQQRENRAPPKKTQINNIKGNNK